MSESLLKKHNAPTAIVVFGGTGDLAQTKLIPALLDLYVQNSLTDTFSVIGLSRKEMTDSEYQSFVRDSINHKGHDHPEDVIAEFCSHFRYVAGSFDETTAYEHVKAALKEFDDSIKQCTNKLFYLAVPPQYYDIIFDQLSQSQVMALCDGVGSWSRLLVEKPFGKDLATAQALEKKLCSLFSDEQIYRIDHYLAKDAIENIISLRFVNSILSDSWNNTAIESIQINLLETKDVSNRGSFYDDIGTLRDVGQNHMLQIFALLTMQPADVHDPKAVREARADALESLSKQELTKLKRARYQGYADTKGVGADSQTETYFKLSFTGATALWQGTTFTFEAGKALDRHVNEAVITFRPLNQCYCAFSDEGHEHRNVLRIKFAPEQQICLTMWTKKPGFAFELQEQELVLLEQAVDESYSPEAYERVLFDCIAGDQTRFVSGHEVEAAWRFITPILEQFKSLPLDEYPIGSEGPKES